MLIDKKEQRENHRDTVAKTKLDKAIKDAILEHLAVEVNVTTEWPEYTPIIKVILRYDGEEISSDYHPIPS